VVDSATAIAELASIPASSGLDVYAVEPREPNKHGVMITIAIIGASLAYAVVLFIEQQNAPLREVAAVLWTSSKTFPATVQCISPSGCKISNTLDPAKVTKCFDVKDKEKMEVKLGWGPDPEKGLSVVAVTKPLSAQPRISSQIPSCLEETVSWTCPPKKFFHHRNPPSRFHLLNPQPQTLNPKP